MRYYLFPRGISISPWTALFWHRKCRYSRIRGFMPIPQMPQCPMYGFTCIFVGPKYIPTYHPHTPDPQGPSQPRMYTPNPQCSLSAECDRDRGPCGSQVLRVQSCVLCVEMASMQHAGVVLSCVTRACTHRPPSRPSSSHARRIPGPHPREPVIMVLLRRPCSPNLEHSRVRVHESARVANMGIGGCRHKLRSRALRRTSEGS